MVMFEDLPVSKVSASSIASISQLLIKYLGRQYEACPMSQQLLKMAAFTMDVIVSQVIDCPPPSHPVQIFCSLFLQPRHPWGGRSSHNIYATVPQQPHNTSRNILS